MQRQTVLVSLCVLVVIAGIWDFVWRPLVERRSTLHTEVERARELHGWVVANIAVAQKGIHGATGGVSLAQASQLIQRSAKRFELSGSVTRIEPRQQRISITLEQAPFSRLVTWLAVVESEFALPVESLAVSRSGPGMVDGQVIIAGVKP